MRSDKGVIGDKRISLCNPIDIWIYYAALRAESMLTALLSFLVMMRLSFHPHEAYFQGLEKLRLAARSRKYNNAGVFSYR